MNIFLSYSHADRALMENLRAQLESRGYHVFDPYGDVEPGANWRLEIGKALEDSDAMLVLLTPESVKSPSVRSDIDFALSNPRFRNRLIPVLGRPTPSVPWILEKLPQKVIPVSSNLSQTAAEIASALNVKRAAAAAK